MRGQENSLKGHAKEDEVEAADRLVMVRGSRMYLVGKIHCIGHATVLENRRWKLGRQENYRDVREVRETIHTWGPEKELEGNLAEMVIALFGLLGMQQDYMDEVERQAEDDW